MSVLKSEISDTEVPSYSVDIFIGGDRPAAVQACREYCMKGLCVSVTEADFVYTGGLESGVRVGLINYPRFPKPPEEIEDEAFGLARFLIERLFQQSCTVVTPKRTVFFSRRSWS